MTNQKDIQTEIKQRRWKWLGHILRKETSNITRVSLRWTPTGKRKRGRPKETWRRTIENEMKELGLTWPELEKRAKDRQGWRELVVALCTRLYEEER